MKQRRPEGADWQKITDEASAFIASLLPPTPKETALSRWRSLVAESAKLPLSQPDPHGFVRAQVANDYLCGKASEFQAAANEVSDALTAKGLSLDLIAAARYHFAIHDGLNAVSYLDNAARLMQ